jgi:hypothetical protein
MFFYIFLKLKLLSKVKKSLKNLKLLEFYYIFYKKKAISLLFYYLYFIIFFSKK